MNKQTAKRALTKQDILKVIQYNGTSPMECLAIDIFTFSYLNAGINFIDIAKLKHSNMAEDHLIYNREKTKKLINVPLQVKALEIIANYQSDKSPYLFPILSSYHYLIRLLRHKIIFELCKCLQGVEIQVILIIQFKHIALQCSFTESHLFNHLKFISYE